MFVFLVLNMIFQDVQHMDETGSWHSTFQVRIPWENPWYIVWQENVLDIES